MPPNPNLFDGRLAVFIGSSGGLAEVTIRQVAANLRASAPAVSAVFVKASHGVGWQGRRDTAAAANLRIDEISGIQRWSDDLAAAGLECHAWSVVTGSLPHQEVNRLAEICLRGGVKSLLLCVTDGDALLPPELRPGFSGGLEAAEALARGLRVRVGPDFHLGLMFDARPDRPRSVFVQRAWFPDIDSLHPLVFHQRFGQSPRQALAACHEALRDWDKPIYPVLQGFEVSGDEAAKAVRAAAQSNAVPGLSLFHYGRGGGLGLSAAELGQAAAHWPSALTAPAPAPRAMAHFFTRRASPPSLVMVDPDDERAGLLTIGYYGDADALRRGWTRGRDSIGRSSLSRAASYNQQTLYVGYTPRLTGQGAYHIETFIPASRANVRDAHYFVVDYPAGQRRETLVVLDQSQVSDGWALLQGGPPDAPIREFQLDPRFEDAGRVNAADITFVEPDPEAGERVEIAFGAMRWRPAGLVSPAVAGFDSPVGTEAERAGPFADGRRMANHFHIWCGNWFDANPYGSRYSLGDRHARHTGADLNLDGPGGPLADRFAPVYAAADGRVISAGFVSAGWKNVIIIEHPVPGEDRVIYARYAHVADMRVRANEPVARGQQICAIGEYAPNNYHLHFDLSPSGVLKTVPGHWPGDNMELVLRFYVDPMAFIKRHHVIR